MANMKLYALTDFPDECSRVIYTPEMLDSMIGQLKRYGISRMYYQYYGNRDDEGMWTNQFQPWKSMADTADEQVILKDHTADRNRKQMPEQLQKLSQES